MVAVMFMRVNSKCVHKRPPSATQLARRVEAEAA